ncbi:MAG: bifunctional oligoribonuclease/PAP phosphatase NrnA [Eubacteriales bacterium]|nr:bifunctional oligoribonuclease/PAP phosphatase NrnA [Eubacteriales bacterium]
MTCSLSDIKKAIGIAENILIIAHIQPDGDTLGSCFALKAVLDSMGKNSDICCESDMPQRYAELFPKQLLLQPQGIDKNYDLAVAVDCADKSRLGKAQKAFKRAKNTINIDHHVTNDQFAKMNYIAEASSVGEIIFELMCIVGIEPDEQIARYLYIAISTDTGNFTYSNTGRKCLSYVSELVELFDLRDVADALFRRRSLVLTKLIARALSRLETYEDGKIAFVTLLSGDMKDIGANGSDCENIVDFAREIEETKVAVFFRELDKGVKISFRSKGDIDVCAVAALYGGGGHLNASGACASGNLKDIREAVLARLIELV